MKKEDFILSAQNLFDYLCAYFGYDWDEVMKRNAVKGTLGEVRVQHSMFDMYKHIQAGDGFQAWKQGVSILRAVIAEENVWKTADDLRTRAEFLFDAAAFVTEYRTIQEHDRQDWLAVLRGLQLLTPEEKQREDLDKCCPRDMLTEVTELLNKPRKLTVCRYKGDKPLSLEAVKKINIGENFVLARNVGEMMMQGKNGASDELNVYVSMNVDDILDFSYFLIAFNNGESWWFVTDLPEFANPSAKQLIAGRGAARFRRDDYDETIFPYIYLDHIETWRKENRQLAKDGTMQREMYTVPLVEWPMVCRVYLNLLVEQAVYRMADDKGTLKRMQFGYEYTHALLLENRTFDGGQWQKAEGYFDYEKDSVNARARVSKMIFRENKQTALVKLDSEKVMDKIVAWNGNLMTNEKFRSVEAWAQCETEAEVRQKQLEMTEEEIYRDRELMAGMIDRNIHNRFAEIFAARDMYVFVYEPDIIYKENAGTFSPYRRAWITRLRTEAFRGWTTEIPGTLGGKVGKLCGRCKKHELKLHHKVGLLVTHYAILAWLAGVKREQLPYRFVNYMSFNFESYTGNHLLDNVNPMYRLKDDMSRENPNGFVMDTIVCRHCHTAMSKKAMDKAVLVINADTCESEGVFDIEGFNEYLKSKGINGCEQLQYI